jgi:hypothetical protein
MSPTGKMVIRKMSEMIARLAAVICNLLNEKA